MDVTSKLIDGVVSLTKLMAHGAMHEACLIEVIRNIEDEAFVLVEDVRYCVYNNNTFMQDVKDYVKENNATVLDIPRKEKVNKTEATVKPAAVEKVKLDTVPKEEDVKHVKDLIRRMLTDNKVPDIIDTTFKDKLVKLQQDLTVVDGNEIVKKVKPDK